MQMHNYEKLLFSARPSPPKLTNEDEQDQTTDLGDDEDNLKRRKRFQSAFKVPTSNRPSHDHSADPAGSPSLMNMNLWQDEDMMYADDGDGDNLDTDED